tara:strand:+ start:187 stop:663 length:477 start_codon:yes stop_codon:yes gene_type:complete
MYIWKEGARWGGDAQSVGDRLDGLSTNGHITPAEVLKDAAKKSSPLHRYFVWEDKQAAQLYRLDQARKLIRSVQIKVSEDEMTPRFVHVKVDQSSSYVQTEVAIINPNYWDSVKADVLSEINSAKRKLDNLKMVETKASRIKAIINTQDHLEKAASAI